MKKLMHIALEVEIDVPDDFEGDIDGDKHNELLNQALKIVKTGPEGWGHKWWVAESDITD